MPKPLEETEPVTATVDHADIRGLVTTLLVSVGRLPQSRDESLSLITFSRVAPTPGLRLIQWLGMLLMQH